jgi:hypothetical protein
MDVGFMGRGSRSFWLIPGLFAPCCSRWVQSSNDSLLDVQSNRRYMPMQYWSKYRYVAHIDGITCSCRLEKLLSLGSLVVRERSGYRWGSCCWQHSRSCGRLLSCQ